eukprot:scaffold118550_cov63-Phaeocystis_antarctica.AAC.3
MARLLRPGDAVCLELRALAVPARRVRLVRLLERRAALLHLELHRVALGRHGALQRLLPRRRLHALRLALRRERLAPRAQLGVGRGRLSVERRLRLAQLRRRALEALETLVRRRGRRCLRCRRRHRRRRRRLRHLRPRLLARLLQIQIRIQMYGTSDGRP